MAATLYDLLPDSTKARYPLASLRPKAVKALSLEVPDEIKTEDLTPMLTEIERRLPRMGAARQAPAATVAPPKPQAPEIVRGFRSGLVGQNVESVGRLLEAVPDLSPETDPNDFYGNLARRGSRWLGERLVRAGQARVEPPKVGSMKDVHSVGDFGDFLGYQIGQGIASTAPPIAGAMAGGAAAGPAGAVLGAGAPSFALNFGDVKQEVDAMMPQASEQDRAQIAALVAIPVSAVETFSNSRMAGRLAKKLVIQKALKDMAAKGLFQRILVEGGKSALIEGGTEAGQELIQAGGVARAAGKPLDPAAVAWRAVDAAVGGALTGGALGGLTGAIPQRTPPGPTPRSQATPKAQQRPPAVAARPAKPAPATPVMSAEQRAEAVKIFKGDGQPDGRGSLKPEHRDAFLARMKDGVVAGADPVDAALEARRHVLSLEEPAPAGQPGAPSAAAPAAMGDPAPPPGPSSQPAAISQRIEQLAQDLDAYERNWTQYDQTDKVVLAERRKRLTVDDRRILDARRRELRAARQPAGAPPAPSPPAAFMPPAPTSEPPRTQQEGNQSVQQQPSAPSVSEPAKEAAPSAVGRVNREPEAARSTGAAKNPESESVAEFKARRAAMTPAERAAEDVGRYHGRRGGKIQYRKVDRSQAEIDQRHAADPPMSAFNPGARVLTPDGEGSVVKLLFTGGEGRGVTAVVRVGKSKRSFAVEKLGLVVPAPRQSAPEQAAPKAPLPQEGLKLASPLEAPKPKPASAEGEAAVAAMGGEARSFADHFADLVKKGRDPEDARVEAEKISGESAPRGFDAEARAKSLIAREAEARGQESLFGAAEPSGAVRGEAPAVAEPAKPAAAEPHRQAALSKQIVARFQAGNPFVLATHTRAWNYTKPEMARLDSQGRLRLQQGRQWLHVTDDQLEHIARQLGIEVPDRFGPSEPAVDKPALKDEPASEATAATMRAQSLHFHEPFQQRDTESGLVDQDHVQALLKKHGGYSADAMAKNPLTVWRDEKGEIGPEGRVYVLSGHHRTYIAQREWARLESGAFAETSTSDREVPVVFHKGDYASAQAEADVSNLIGKPNTLVEKAGVARRLADKGASLEDIALQVTQGRVAQAKDLLSLSYLDPTLQREYFGEKGLPLTIGAYLGEFAKTYKAHPEHQRTWLRKIGRGPGEIAGIEDLKVVVEGFLKDLRDANQLHLLAQMDMGEGAISPNMSMAFLGGVRKMVGKMRREAATAVKLAKKAKERASDPEERAAHRRVLELHERAFEKAAKIEAEMEDLKHKARVKSFESGGKLSDALYEVQQEIEKRLRDAGLNPESGSTVIFSEAAAAVGTAARWVSDRILAGTARAVRREIAAHPVDLKVVHRRTGQVQQKIRVNEYVEDLYTQYAWARFLARGVKLGADFRLNLTGGNILLPPPLVRGHQASQAKEAAIDSWFSALWLEAMGDKKTAEFFGEGGTGSVELGRALEGKPHSIPKEHRGAVERVRALFAEDGPIWQAFLQHADEHGQEPPKYRKDWFFPHVVDKDRAAPLSKLIEAIETRAGHEMPEAEISERRNRFYEHREGDTSYLTDATKAFRIYLQTAARKLAWDSFLQEAAEYLTSPAAQDRWDKGSPIGETERAALVRDFLAATMFRKKSAFESMMDRMVGRLLFAKSRRGIQQVGLKKGAALVGKSVDELELLGVGDVVLVPAGVEYRAPENAVELGRSSEGGTYVGIAEGEHVWPLDSPMPRAVTTIAVRLMTDKRKLLSGKLARDPEALYRRESKVEATLLRLEKDPFAAAVHVMTSGVSRGILGWNLRMNLVNLMSSLITTYPEYGLIPYLRGIGAAGGSIGRRARRGALTAMVRAAERRGHLSAKEAEAARGLIPLMKNEVYAEAAGVAQGEIQAARQRTVDIMEGRSPALMRVIRALGPYGIMSFTEGWNRTLDIVAADAYARRSLDMQGSAPAAYATLDAARSAFIPALEDPTSAESWAANRVGMTQYSYNALGQPLWAASAGGRATFQLSTWPLNNLLFQTFRTTAGAMRTSGAAARGAANAALGGRLGRRESLRAPAGHQLYARQQDPKTWFERFLDDNGAGQADRHHAAVFVRQMAVASLLVGAGASLKAKVDIVGVPPQFVFVLWLMRQFFPDDESLVEWLSSAERSTTISPERGVPMGPVLGAAGEINKAVRARWISAGNKRGRDRDDIGPATYFPWDVALNVTRRFINPGDVEQQRWVRENPEWFASSPWVFDLYGIKRVQTGDTAHRIKHHLGLSTPAEDRRNERRVPR